MTRFLQLLEFDCIQRDSISSTAFAWLENLIYQRKTGEVEFLRYHRNKDTLQVRNFVGVLETPCGTCIEILPKTTEYSATEEARRLLWKMLKTIYKLPSYSSEQAMLAKKSGSLIDLLIALFLQEANQLYHRGLRSDYQRLAAEKPFVKGRLCLNKQLRQPASRLHRFHIEYHSFLPNRAENRLLKSALQRAKFMSRSPDNQRLAQALLWFLDAVPSSSNYAEDFTSWSTQRDMVHYRGVKPWISLLLLQEAPWFLKGGWQGISLLFPMEKLFEAYVAICLKKQLSQTYQLKTQLKRHHLIDSHQNQPLFKLKPDLCILQNQSIKVVLDTKWKKINQNKKPYDLSQSDFYQLFAYGQKYLHGNGTLILIYPQTTFFKNALDRFDFSSDLHLYVLPFCLQSDQLRVPSDGFTWLKLYRGRAG